MVHDSYHGRGLRGVRLRVGDVSVSDLADVFGTPLYVFDGARLESRVQSILEAARTCDAKVFYSVKAHPSVELCRRVLELGLGLDVCSLGDLRLAILAGASPDAVSYTGCALTKSDIAQIHDFGCLVNLDSEQEFAMWVSEFPRESIGVRFNPGIRAGFSPHVQAGAKDSRFGMSQRQIIAIAERMPTMISRLHCHIGSSIGSVDPLLRAVEMAFDIARLVESVTAVNLGGGLGARFHPDDPKFDLAGFFRRLRSMADAFFDETGRRIELQIEPGEYVSSESGYLLTRVCVTKECPDHLAALCDGGMNLHPAPALYGSWVYAYVDGADDSRPKRNTILFGPTNYGGDVLATQRSLPELRPGDLILVRNAGAYAYSRSTQFNGRPRPGEVWVDSGEFRLARQPETLDSVPFLDLGDA